MSVKGCCQTVLIWAGCIAVVVVIGAAIVVIQMANQNDLNQAREA